MMESARMRTRKVVQRGVASFMVVTAAWATALSDAPAADGTEVGQAAAAAQKDLDASLKELTALRETIAAEKLPLNRKLAQLEERLAELRRRNEDTLRALDTGSLDFTRLESEKKLRQEELGYLGNLLDEYARNFESKLDVSEFQVYATLLEQAKQAPGSVDLTEDQKLERQIAVVKESLVRVQDLVGGKRFAGSAVDPKGAILDGEFALIGPLAIFASADGKTAGLALPQTGSTRPAVRPLEASFSAGIVSIVKQGMGVLPIDPTRGSALEELVHRASLIHIFKKGGPIMWPLLAVSVLALATVLERIFFILSERRKRDYRALQGLLGAVECGDMDEAARIGSASGYYVVRALGYALQHRERSLSNALLYANAQEIKRFSRGLAILDTSITISPLLGLLGTVTGMMNSFSLIGGELGAPGAITGGIAEALIATAFGLTIAILALIPFNYLNNLIEAARHELEAASTQLELIVRAPVLVVDPSQGRELRMPAHAGA